MVLTTIYLTRHACRQDWDDDDPSGQILLNSSLSRHGEEQAEELAAHSLTLDPPIDVIYSSPYDRYIRSVEPIARSIEEQTGRKVEIRGEPELGKWHGLNGIGKPKPAPVGLLYKNVPQLSATYSPIWIPYPGGESIEDLYARVAYVIANIIRQLDADPSGPQSVLICTHGSVFITLGRVSTGRKPAEVSEYDFVTFTSCLSTFVRREHALVGELTAIGSDNRLPYLHWTNGVGIGGKWECTVNGDCSYLNAGAEKGWCFTGEEFFDTTLPAEAFGGLAKVVEGRTPDNPS